MGFECSVFRMYSETYCPGNAEGPDAGHVPTQRPWRQEVGWLGKYEPTCIYCRQRIWRNVKMLQWRAYRHMIFEEPDILDQ